MEHQHPDQSVHQRGLEPQRHPPPAGDGTGTTSWTPYGRNYFALLKTDGPGNWCQLYQSFTAQKDDVLEFAYFWDSRDYIYKDAAGTPVYPFYDDTAQGRIVTGTNPNAGTSTLLFKENVWNDPDDYWGTPWTAVNYTIPADGAYTVVFEIKNMDRVGGLGFNDSYLGVDLVPEPVTLAGVALGLGALVRYARRRMA